MDIKKLLDEYPILKDVKELKEVFWINPKKKKFDELTLEISMQEILEASSRLDRFSDYLRVAFSKEDFNGIIESTLTETSRIKQSLAEDFKTNLNGRLLFKCDNDLPIAGSVKARGGIYEVLKYAEDLALSEGILKISDDYKKFNQKKFKDFFSQYKISVGSTGNLGLSIGIISSKLGFQVDVHMSRDAKTWKKKLLKEHNVNVIEYESDYSEAVSEGRKRAENEENNYFVDDENSKNLFLGYAVAAIRLKNQLDVMNIFIDENNPLNVFIPCGVGGAPGGIAYGLKQVFKDNVNIYFGEPTHSPCMLLSLVTGLGAEISVNDLGIDNKTIADGLAVGRASKLVSRLMENLVDGCFTVEDQMFYKMIKYPYKERKFKLEPSATAGMVGYLRLNKMDLVTDRSNNIVWATGGRLVPEDIFQSDLKKGEE